MCIIFCSISHMKWFAYIMEDILITCLYKIIVVRLSVTGGQQKGTRSQDTRYLLIVSRAV